MSNFFFIFKEESSNSLVRVRVKGLVSHNYEENYVTNFLEDFKEQYIDDLLSKSSDQIATTYRKRVNQLKIFFKYQFNFIESDKINSDKYTEYSEDEFKILLGQINFLFDEQIYGNKTNEELDMFKLIVEPLKLLKLIDNSIDEATNINKKINDNYDLFIEKDKELLINKNTLLLSRDPSIITDIFKLIKEREKISYLLLDIDLEISNCLFELTNLKYLKIRNDDILVTLKSIKEQVNIVNNILPIFNEYDNKYLS